MADEPLPPVGGKAPLPVSSPKDSAPPVSPTGEQAPVGIGPSAVVTLSDGALEAAEDDHHAIDDDKHALKDAASLIKDLTKAVRKLQKAVFRFMHHLEKLQHHAEKIADKFFDRVSRDIGGGEEHDTDDLGDELKGLKALIKALARFRKGQADRSLFGALNTLLLIREVTFTQTVTGIGITRILLDAATQVREDGEASGDTASTAPTVGETPVDLEI